MCTLSLTINSKVSKAMLVNFKKAGVNPKKKVFEFKVTKEAVLPGLLFLPVLCMIVLLVGLQLTARHFIPGQYLDVRGVT